MGREEQQEEREVLDSIFPDEITDVTEHEFRLSIKLDVGDIDPEEEEEDEARMVSIINLSSFGLTVSKQL